MSGTGLEIPDFASLLLVAHVVEELPDNEHAAAVGKFLRVQIAVETARLNCRKRDKVASIFPLTLVGTVAVITRKALESKIEDGNNWRAGQAALILGIDPADGQIPEFTVPAQLDESTLEQTGEIAIGPAALALSRIAFRASRVFAGIRQ